MLSNVSRRCVSSATRSSASSASVSTQKRFTHKHKGTKIGFTAFNSFLPQLTVWESEKNYLFDFSPNVSVRANRHSATAFRRHSHRNCFSKRFWICSCYSIWFSHFSLLWFRPPSLSVQDPPCITTFVVINCRQRASPSRKCRLLYPARPNEPRGRVFSFLTAPTSAIFLTIHIKVLFFPSKISFLWIKTCLQTKFSQSVVLVVIQPMKKSVKVTADEAVRLIEPNNRVFIQTAAAAPQQLIAVRIFPRPWSSNTKLRIETYL